MSSDVQSDFSLFDIFQVVRRHRLKCVLFFLVIFGSVAAYTLFSSKTYRSEGKLFVRLGRENVTLDPTATIGQGPVSAVPSSRENEINSVLEVLHSRQIAERVVDRLGPEVILQERMPSATATDSNAVASPSSRGPISVLKDWLRDLGALDTVSDRDQAINKLDATIQINVVRKSNVISVSFEAEKPEAAQAIVREVIEAAQEQHIRAHRPPHGQDFLAAQTKHLQAQLNATENELREVKTETGLASPTEQRQILVQRIGKLEDEALAANSTLAAAEAQVREMREALKNLPEELNLTRTTGLPNGAADTMRSQLYTLQIREKELLSKYKADHQEVVAVQRQITDALAVLMKEEKSRVQDAKGPNPVFQAAKTALLAHEPVLASLKAKAAVVNTQIASAKDSLKSLNENEMRIVRLQRELDLADVKYRKYTDNLEQARLDAEMESRQISNISVVESATLDPRSVKPKRMMNLALGMVIGVFGAVGLALLCEFSRVRPRPATPLNGSVQVSTVNGSHPAPRQSALPHEGITTT